MIFNKKKHFSLKASKKTGEWYGKKKYAHRAKCTLFLHSCFECKNICTPATNAQTILP